MTTGDSNVELAWEFARIGRSLPPELFPKCAPTALTKILFKEPKFNHDLRWERCGVGGLRAKAKANQARMDYEPRSARH